MKDARDAVRNHIRRVLGCQLILAPSRDNEKNAELGLGAPASLRSVTDTCSN